MSSPDRQDAWIAAIVEASRLKGTQLTRMEMKQNLHWTADSGDDLMPSLQRVARRMGLNFTLAETSLADVVEFMLPVLVELNSGHVALVLRRGDDTVVFSLPLTADSVETELPAEEFAAQVTGGRVGFVELLSNRARDARIEGFMKPRRKSWFRDIVLKDKRSYGEIVLASFTGNLLAFGTALFAMQVWDRVIPAQSIPTLWVLALGVVLALVFEFLLRTARVALADRVGKRSDLEISSLFFARALDIRNDARPKSTGAFIAQVRDMEQLRELLTSTTVTAFIDLPFVLLFLALFTYLAGPLIIVLLVVLVLIVLPGLLLQIPLARLAREGMSESALRNAILVESVERIGEIKALQAESRFQSVWERCTLTNAETGVEQRFYTSVFGNWTQTLQQLAYTAVIVAGAYQVFAGEMTMGSLLACSILTNRVVVLFMPMAQVFTRWQNAKVALGALDDLLARPVDHGPNRELLRRTALRGDYRFEDVTYAYGEDSGNVLEVERLSIRAGERVAILGRIGAGKTTLLQLVAGMALPTSGRLLLDNTDITLIDPADVRRETGYLSQSAQLFLGSIRENLLMGTPGASDEDILAALSVSGGLPLVQSQSYGLDLMLSEGGVGLSGGQRQTLLLARTLLRSPNILLLDEPSAAMDETTERQLVEQLDKWLGRRTLVVTTNRAGMLGLANRVVVMDQGRVVMDGPKEEVLKALSRPASAVPAAAAG